MKPVGWMTMISLVKSSVILVRLVANLGKEKKVLLNLMGQVANKLELNIV